MRVYLIKKFHHVSNERQTVLRRQKLVAISDEFPERPLPETDFPATGDWLVEFLGADRPLLLMKVEQYSYEPLKHLYVKHFLSISHSFNVGNEQTSPLFRNEIENKDHLAKFSEESVYSLLKYLENNLIEQTNKATRKMFQSIYGASAEVEALVDPNTVNGAISKAALETYIKNNNGKLSTVKEFDKITKRFIYGSGRRKRK